MVDQLIFRCLLFYGLRVNHRGKWWIHQMLTKLFRLNIDQEFKVLRNNTKWILNPSDSVQRDLFWFGEKDKWEFVQLKKILKPGSVIFDIGANFGYYSIMIANILNQKCTVFGFEPDTHNYKLFERNIRLNRLKCINAFPFGLSDRERNVNLINIPGNSGGTFVDSSTANGDVKLVDLKDFCAERDIKSINFMKIDVEGHEPFILKAYEELATTLKEWPIILVEFNSTCLARVKSSSKELMGILRDLGYYLYTPKREKLVPLSRLPLEPVFMNVFCFLESHDCFPGKAVT